MKRISKDTKLTIQVILAVILVIAGVVLLFLGFYVPKVGEIHDSILISYGEVSTFGGSLLGLDYHYAYKRYKTDIEEKQREKYENEE